MTQSKTARVTRVGSAGRADPAKQVLGLSHFGLRRESLPWGFLGAASFSSPSAIHVGSVKAKKAGRAGRTVTAPPAVSWWARGPGGPKVLLRWRFGQATRAGSTGIAPQQFLGGPNNRTPNLPNPRTSTRVAVPALAPWLAEGPWGNRSGETSMGAP